MRYEHSSDERRSLWTPSRRDFLRVMGSGAALVAMGGLTACGSSDGGSGGGGDQSMVLGHGADPGNPRSLAAERFAEIVNERTSGQIEVQIQGSEQLGSDTEMLDSVQSGTLDLTANSQGPLATLVPEVALFGLPFMFDTPQDAYEVVDGEIGDKMVDLAEEQGLTILAWWDNGIRQITNNGGTIQTPDDVSGLDIRVPEDDMTIDIFEALGANPSTIDFGELYTALQQGTVDGQENPVVNIYASDIYEVQDYMSMTGHKYEVTPFIISTSVWEGLSEENQGIIQEAATEAKEFQREKMNTQSEEQLGELADALELTREVDTQAFVEATRSVYDTWREQYPDLVDRFVEAAGVEL